VVSISALACVVEVGFRYLVPSQVGSAGLDRQRVVVGTDLAEVVGNFQVPHYS
jgi:hypothetical protein